MKSVLLFVVMVMAACRHTDNPPEATGQGEENVPLTLNHDKKWKADSITADHVAGLKRITDHFRLKPSPSAEDYRALGGDLVSAVNRMVTDCKMTGAAHEALHHWLHPVIRDAGKLKKTTGTAVAKPVLNTLDQQINAYYHYFE